MRTFANTTGSLLLLALGACASQGPVQPGTQMHDPQNGSSSEAPVSTNSLPRGDVVNAPEAQPTGIVGRTRVPSR